jgi:hypothetical protein
MSTVHPALVTIALDKCDRDAFEKYSQTVFGQVIGPKFKPLGGMHDGGADGFVEVDPVLMPPAQHAFFKHQNS